MGGTLRLSGARPCGLGALVSYQNRLGMPTAPHPHPPAESRAPVPEGAEPVQLAHTLSHGRACVPPPAPSLTWDLGLGYYIWPVNSG